jgi:hypothetical protein
MRNLYLLNSLAVTIFWVYFLSDGFHATGLLDGVYELQAQALADFRLSIEPGPQKAFYFDACLFNGKYYFYQGLLPAALHACFMNLLGRVLSSYLVTSGFLFCFVYFFQRIIGDITGYILGSTDHLKKWLKLLSIPLLWLSLFNLPFPVEEFSWFFGRFSIYEQQIIFALAIIMPAIFLMIRGLIAQNEQFVCLAAFLCSLAAWIRITWFIFAVIVIFAAYIYCVWRCKGKLFGAATGKQIFLLSTAILLLIGLLVLNYIRFDSFFEFGQKHLNPAHQLYLRAIVGKFSPGTKFWDFIFNIFAYYGSPELIKWMGLLELSSRTWEYSPTSYFHFNPQFLLILVLLPLAVYRAFRKNRKLFLMMICVGITALYMNLLITTVGPMVIMRYFIEFYYFNLLLFFMVIVILIPARFSLLVMIILLCGYLPGNFEAFLKVRPEIRPPVPNRHMAVMADAAKPKFRTPFLVKNPVWFNQSVSFVDVQNLKDYNSIGVYFGPGAMIFAKDTAALYTIPTGMMRGGCSGSALKVESLKSIDANGTVKFYVDGYHIGNLRVNMQTPVNGCLPITRPLKHKVPYQILMIFIAEGKQFLPPITVKKPNLKFKKVSLLTV